MFYLQAVRGIASISQIHFYARLPSLQALFASEKLNINFITESNRVINTSVLLYLLLSTIFILLAPIIQLYFTAISDVSYLVIVPIFICVLIERLVNYKLHIKALLYINLFHKIWFFSMAIFFIVFSVLYLELNSYNYGSYIILIPYIISSLAAFSLSYFIKTINN